MPRYFMNFIARTLLPDSAGLEFEDDSTAIAYAAAMAEQLAGSALLDGCAILLTDEQDNTISEVELTTTPILAPISSSLPAV